MESKHLVLSLPSPKPQKKEKKKKVITQTENWDLLSQHLSLKSQTQVLADLSNPEIERSVLHTELEKALKTKLAGYKAQDTIKNIYDPAKFISFDNLVGSLAKSQLLCFYCRNPVLLFYEFVREPRQWSLERIDNAQGHNMDNVEIACLECNLRRRTMYHERYLFTKQCTIHKLG
jgi:hypothetical protein